MEVSVLKCATVLWLAVASRQGMANANAQCDRRCLLEVLTTYTEALVGNDTSRLHASPDVRVTGNAEVTKLGKGEVWGSVKRIAYRQALVDPVTASSIPKSPPTSDPPGRSCSPSRMSTSTPFPAS
jgi:hypothetical protein